jgi:hypothetical protein
MKLIKVVQATVAAAFFVGALTLLPGCRSGGSKTTINATGNKTLGQELEDLQKSYDKGIITKKEYEDTKKKLMKKYTDY